MSKELTSEVFGFYPVPPVAIKAERYGRIREMMDREGLDALVVCSSAGLVGRGNLRFMTNYSPVTRFAAAVFPRRGEPVLLVPYVVHQFWAGSVSWVEDIRLALDYGAEVPKALAEAGVVGGRVGLVGMEFMPPSFVPSIRQSLPRIELVSVAEQYARVRLIKGPTDIAIMKNSATIADRVFGELLATIKSGLTENEIYARAEYLLRLQGCEGSLVLISSTAETGLPIPSARKVQPGDALQISLEPIGPGGYLVQIVRTVFLGEPSPQAREVYGICLRAQIEAERALGPGRKVSEVAAIGQEVLQGTPFGPRAMQKVPFGHGMGVELGEPPRIAGDDPTVLEPSMAIVLHPNLYVDGIGVFIGDTYLITNSGVDRLSSTRRDLMVLP